MVKNILLVVLGVSIGYLLGLSNSPVDVVYKGIPTPELVYMTKVECMSEHKLVDPEKVICPEHFCNAKSEYERGYNEAIVKFSPSCLTK